MSRASIHEPRYGKQAQPHKRPEDDEPTDGIADALYQK